MKQTDKYLFFWILPGVLGSLWIVYILKRAWVLSFTIDESQSYGFALFNSRWDILTYKEAFSNNHFLNTLWIKYCQDLGRVDEWMLRLPNVLAGLVYARYAWRLSACFKNKPWLPLAGFVLLISNPFVTDFFSLCRGYGLALAFQMTGLFYAVRFCATRRTSDVFKASLAAALAVCGHFMWLNHYLALLGLFGVFCAGAVFYGAWKACLKPAAVLIAVTAALACFLYGPFERLLRDGPKNYGDSNGFLAGTFQSLVRSSYSGSKDLGDTPALWILIWILFGLTLLQGALSLWDWRKKQLALAAFPGAFGAGLFAMSTLVVILLHVFFKQQYPVTRMTLSFYPTLALLWIGGMALASGHKVFQWWGLAVALMSGGVFLRAANFRYTIEWAGHAVDKQIMEWILKHETGRTENNKLSIAADSYFGPGLTHYMFTNDIRWMHRIEAWSAQSRPEKMDYLVLYAKDAPQLSPPEYDEVARIKAPQYMLWDADVSILKRK